MSELFSSAWNYISGGGGSDGGGAGSRFVGQEVDLGSGRVVKIKKVIAEGKWEEDEGENAIVALLVSSSERKVHTSTI